jgi:hypothetical protein
MFDPARLVFIDETCTNTAMVRLSAAIGRLSVRRTRRNVRRTAAALSPGTRPRLREALDVLAELRAPG